MAMASGGENRLAADLDWDASAPQNTSERLRGASKRLRAPQNISEAPLERRSSLNPPPICSLPCPLSNKRFSSQSFSVGRRAHVGRRPSAFRSSYSMIRRPRVDFYETGAKQVCRNVICEVASPSPLYRLSRDIGCRKSQEAEGHG